MPRSERQSEVEIGAGDRRRQGWHLRRIKMGFQRNAELRSARRKALSYRMKPQDWNMTGSPPLFTLCDSSLRVLRASAFRFLHFMGILDAPAPANSPRNAQKSGWGVSPQAVLGASRAEPSECENPTGAGQFHPDSELAGPPRCAVISNLVPCFSSSNTASWLHESNLSDS